MGRLVNTLAPQVQRPSKSIDPRTPSSSLDNWPGAALHVVTTMSSGLRQKQREPASDRGKEGQSAEGTTVYSPEQMISHAATTGRTAYAAVIRAGRPVAIAERAYNRAYMRAIPPCWIALLASPTPPRLPP